MSASAYMTNAWYAAAFSGELSRTPLLRTLLGLADVSRVRGKRGAAAAAMDEALSVLRRHLGPNHPDVKTCEEDLRRLGEEPQTTEALTHPN